MKVNEIPLTFAEHHLDILGQDIRWAFTGPLVLWFLYWPSFFCIGRIFPVLAVIVISMMRADFVIQMQY